MRVLLSTWGGRGDVEPMVGLAAQLRTRGAEVRVCAPPDEDFARRLADVGVELVGVGPSARTLTKMTPGTASIPDTAKAIIAGQFETMPQAAEGCDIVVATGALPAAAGALAVAEKLGIRAVSVTFQQLTLPAPDRRPLAYPGRPLPEGVTDSAALWDFDRESIELLFGAALNENRVANGLAPVGDVRAFVVTDEPWLASDPVLDPWSDAADYDVVQTGARGCSRTRARWRPSSCSFSTPARRRCTSASGACRCTRPRTRPRRRSPRSARTAGARC